MASGRRYARGGYVYHVLNRAVARLLLFENPGKKRCQEPFLLRSRSPTVAGWKRMEKRDGKGDSVD
jgi:hypothetical protein